MSAAQYFPLGIASGEAFCNRSKERSQLISNFKGKQHTVVISPRRYGKSSLILNAIEQSKITYERVDMFVALDVKMVESKIITGVKNLIANISTGPEQAISLLKNYFKQLKSKWIIGTDGIHLELEPHNLNDPITNIADSLKAAELLLSKKNKNAIFFIDEFQEIGILDSAKGIEAAIRQVAQESKHLIFVFSGSNRHILSQMVDDRTRPLYMLCDRINLGRIDASHYHDYINLVAQKTWKKSLSEEVFQAIISITERHPYYMNALCNKIWAQGKKKPPTKLEVENIWVDYVLQEESKTAKELSLLSELQKKLLILIAKGQTSGLTSQFVLKQTNVSSSAIIKALRLLNERDYLSKNTDGSYYLIDPLLQSSLQMFYGKI